MALSLVITVTTFAGNVILSPVVPTHSMAYAAFIDIVIVARSNRVPTVRFAGAWLPTQLPLLRKLAPGMDKRAVIWVRAQAESDQRKLHDRHRRALGAGLCHSLRATERAFVRPGRPRSLLNIERRRRYTSRARSESPTHGRSLLDHHCRPRLIRSGPAWDLGQMCSSY